MLARDLAAEGKRVVLAGLSTQEPSVANQVCGQGHLKIIKLPADSYDKTSLKARVLWTIKTNTRIAFALWPELRACKEVIFTGSPPLLLHWVAPLNILLRKRIVYRITDFYPECLIAARGRSSWWLSLIYRLTLFWRRRVTLFEVLGQDQKSRLLEIGIEGEQIRVKPDRLPVAIDTETTPLERPKLEVGKVLLLYSGNWGVAHDYLTFLHAYRRHHRQGSGRVVLWLNAIGAAVEPIEEFLRAEHLPYVRRPLVPLDKLANLLVTPDAHLITLSDAFVGFVLPSKVHGCLASGRAILFIGSDRSDVHALCLESGSYYERISVGDVEGCCAALEHLVQDIDQAGGAKQPSVANAHR